MTVTVFLLLNQGCDPLASLIIADTEPARVIRTVFIDLTDRTGIVVVVTPPWPRKGAEYTQLLQPHLSGPTALHSRYRHGASAAVCGGDRYVS